jgi:hypothetical protein
VSSANGGGDNYTIKELLTNFVIPDIREIKDEIKLKVNRSEFEKLKSQVEQLEERETARIAVLADRNNAFLRKDKLIIYALMMLSLGVNLLVVYGGRL